jgi:hypothetical protein
MDFNNVSTSAVSCARVLFGIWVGSLAALAGPVSLFDGKSLAGWEEYTRGVWRVRDGVIVGGSLEGNPQNEFLSATRSYANFVLRLEYKLEGSEGFVNGGVQFRSKRIAKPPNEMSGFQADIGAGYSGCLYDESRRNKMLVKADPALIERIEKKAEWNTYEIYAEGKHIRLVLNGETTVRYEETDSAIEADGLIALQIHGKCKAEISFRNITIEVLGEPVAFSGDPGVPFALKDSRCLGVAEVGAMEKPFKPDIFKPSGEEAGVFVGRQNLFGKQRRGAIDSRLESAFGDRREWFRSGVRASGTKFESWGDLN